MKENLMIDTNKIDFDKMNGLVPAIITDNSTGQVLMPGFMNKEAVEKLLMKRKSTTIISLQTKQFQ